MTASYINLTKWQMTKRETGDKSQDRLAALENTNEGSDGG